MNRLDQAHLATFEPYVIGPAGARKFENRMPTGFRGNPYFERRPRRRKRIQWPSRHTKLMTVAIDRAAKIAAARKWIPLPPPLAYRLLWDDARLPRRRPL